MRVIVCGSRTFDDYKKLYGVLDGLKLVHTDTIISGRATGADQLGEMYADEAAIGLEIYPAEWNKYGRAAGPIRNKQMLDTGVDLVVAFPVGEARGTRHMMNIARKAGVEVIEVS